MAPGTEKVSPSWMGCQVDWSSREEVESGLEEEVEEGGEGYLWMVARGKREVT